ncbi:hypothetical protein ACIPY3_02395 [Paenarthrobacter sp. NPDC089714]|uniref:hypothetical protein n=1 Tax=Paenarthrobacter sp. NPDC089714 TaxID=3364377 RepID=UPI0038243996
MTLDENGEGTVELPSPNVPESPQVLAVAITDELGYECHHTGSPDESVPGACPDCWQLGQKVAERLEAEGYRKVDLEEAWEEGRRAGWSERTRSILGGFTYEQEEANRTPNPYQNESGG